MNRLKSWFMLPYMVLSLLAVLHALVQLIFFGNVLWLAPLLACAPLLALMVWFARAGSARSSRYLPGLLVPALLGGVLSVLAALAAARLDRFLLPAYGLVVGAGGACLYVFWYSRLPGTGAALQPGMVLPDVVFRNLSGAEVSSRELRGASAVWLFYRGNWCPLCMAQIREVADRYRELEARGVRVLLVSPQPETQTRDLAQRHAVNFEFLVDPDGRAARALGILHEAGLPRGMGMERQGYRADTVLPTVVITDSEGRILWVDQTDNYRVRPEPDVFLAELDRLVPAAAETRL